MNLGFESFEGYAWFAGRFSAYVAIFVTVVWQSFPFIALSLLAALQTIPKETLQAAQVDGANAWNRFRLITLPLLRPVIAVLVVFCTIWDFKIFDQIYVMASGVPDRMADTAAVAAYREGFALGHYGLASAAAVVLFLILLVFSHRLRAPDRQGGRAVKWLLQARLDVRRDDRDQRLRAVPRLLGRDHVAEAAARDLQPHAGLLAQRPAVGPVPASCWARATSAARC